MRLIQAADLRPGFVTLPALGTFPCYFRGNPRAGEALPYFTEATAEKLAAACNRSDPAKGARCAHGSFVRGRGPERFDGLLSDIGPLIPVGHHDGVRSGWGWREVAQADIAAFADNVRDVLLDDTGHWRELDACDAISAISAALQKCGLAPLAGGAAPR